MPDDRNEHRIFFGRASAWFHGSPQRLEVLQEGSTVTPVVELAESFSHKPTRVGWTFEEHNGERWITIDHNGEHDGYLYKVLVDDPDADLRQHPTSGFAAGEEMLTNRDLPLEFLREVPLDEGRRSIRFLSRKG